ncbi:MAG TPA: cellulase family glycosylhydrolase [Tepidisphaeraceae bacterium]
MLLIVVAAVPRAKGQAVRRADPGSDPHRSDARAANGVGVQPRFGSDLTRYDAMLGKVSDKLGVSWVRMYWNWAWVEAEPGRRYLKPVEVAVSAAHRHGLKIIVLATGAPPWANGRKGQDFPPTDAHVADYAAYAAALAQAGADAIEVWNEPNNRAFWASKPDPARLAPMQVAAYRAIKAARPKAIVLTGGLTQVFDDPQTFFARLLAADPKFIDSFDAVALHPYNEPSDPLQPGPSGMKNILTVQTPAIHRLLAGRGRVDVPIWFTEYGIATHGHCSVDEPTQATYLRHFFEGVAGLRARGIPIGVSIIYAFQDDAAYLGADDQPFFGMLHADGTEKPAAAVLRDQAARR